MAQLDIHSSVESVEGLDVTRVTSYGASDKDADVLLLAQHGGESRQLAQRLNGSQVEEPGVYEDFLRIDRDAGTPELAHAVAEKIISIAGDLRVRVVEVLYERGILDPNRIVGIAIRNFLNLGEHADLVDLMMRMHDRTSEVVGADLAEISQGRGLFVDLHSMAPYDPVGLGEEQPGTLLAYNDAYRSGRGKRRSLDVVTDIPGEKTVAHPILTQNLLSRFVASGVPTKLNDPYPKPGMPVRMIKTIRYMEAHPGIALDFSKDQLCRGLAEDRGWELANLEADPDKIEKMAGIIAGAVVETLREVRL